MQNESATVMAEASGAPAPEARRRRTPRLLVAAFYLVLAGFCLAAISRTIGADGFAAIAAAFQVIGDGDIIASALCVGLIFATLWALEQAVLSNSKAPRAAHAKPVSTLVANAVSLGAGFGMVSGGALRARLYEPAGLNAGQAFYIASAVTTASLLSGAVIAAASPLWLGEDSAPVRWLAFTALGLLGAALALAGPKGRTFFVFGRTVALPNATALSLWLLLGGLDWAFSAGALYVLLPEGERLPFAEFLALFSLSHLVAMPTGAPSGLGVFDTLMIGAASDEAASAHVAAALIIYRALAFVMPVSLGLIGATVLEARRGRTGERSGAFTHALLQTITGDIWRRSASPMIKGEVFHHAAGAAPLSLTALTGQGPLLVLSPHPDDDIIGCGGLIAAARAAGRDVHIAYLTDGCRSHLGSLRWTSTRLAKSRRAEATRAAALLDVPVHNLHFCGNRDGALLFNAAAQQATKALLEELVRKHRVGCLLASWVHDPHPDHVATAKLAEALAREHKSLKLLFYPVYGRFLPDQIQLHDRRWRAHRFDISAEHGLKASALAAHRTQVTSLIGDAVFAFRPKRAQARFVSAYEIFLE